MGANDERTMILNMLKEGKISIEEADALLEVLEETTRHDGPSGFHDATEGRGPEGTRPPEGERPLEGRGRRDERGGPRDRHRQRPHRPGEPHAFVFDFDFGGLRDSLRETMKGVSESLKTAFDGFSEMDFGGEFSRVMGRVRAEAARTVVEEAGDASAFSLANRWGDVRIRGTDETAICVQAAITVWGAGEGTARGVADSVRIGLRRDGGALVLEAETEEHAAVRVDYEISLPARLRVTASTASGDLWLEDLESSQVISSLSGDINVANLGRSASDRQEMSTKSGDVVAAELHGEVTLSTLSGDVMVNGFTGTLSATTKSGDIRVEEGRGTVVLQSVSGDLEAELAGIDGGAVRLSSVSGDLSVELPAATGVTVRAKTASGDIDCGLDLDVTEKSSRLLAGSSGDASVTVELTTVSGDIEIGER